MADGGVEFYYVEAYKVVLVLVLDFFKPVDNRCRVFPLVEIGCSLDFVVDSIEDVFADFVFKSGKKRVVGTKMQSLFIFPYNNIYKTLYFLCIEHCTTEKSKHRLTNPLQVKICRTLYDYPQWKNSTLATPQRIFLYHHRTTSYNDLSKNPSSFYVGCAGKPTSS